MVNIKGVTFLSFVKLEVGSNHLTPLSRAECSAFKNFLPVLITHTSATRKCCTILKGTKITSKDFDC